ncbi:TolB family protein [Candidatus Latescibacterota bacterium]
MRNLLLFIVYAVTFCTFSDQSHARYNPGWKWRTVRTDNFTIYYPKGHEEFARRIVLLCDEVYDDVTGYLGVKPRNCPIVLNPGTDMFNGFMSGFPNRISLFETPTHSVRGFGPGSDIIDLVFTHEYSHYVHITTRLGWYGLLTRIVGDGLAASNAIAPMWIVEGIATNTETMFTDGGRGQCSLFKGKMMSFAEGRGLWGLSSAGMGSPYSPPGNQRYYLAGYHMVEYLNGTYGKDAFPELSRYQARHPIGGTGKAIRHVTGKSPVTFYREFLADYEKKAGDLKEKAGADRFPKGKAILAEPIDDISVHFWTERGTIQAIRSGYGGKSVLVEIDPVTDEVVRETETGIIINLEGTRRTSDGRIVFGSPFLHPLGGMDLDTAELVVFDPTAKKQSRITEGGHIYSADLSPDGKSFVAARRNGMWIELVLLDREGSFVRTLVWEKGMLCESPRWSPDGSTIAAVVKVGRNSDIVLIDPENGTMRTLFISDVHEDNEPSFSSDGRWIAFSSNRSGVWNIHAWDTVEKKLYQLTSEVYAAGNPEISPEGEILSFLSMYRGVNRVCTIPFNPRAGKEIYVQAGEIVNKSGVSRMQPEVALESGGIPLGEAYRPFIHSPYFGFDEDGSRVGARFIGADPVGINSYDATLLYGVKSKRPGYNIVFTNRTLWPTIRARIYDSADVGNTIDGGKNFWFREQGAELSLCLDVVHKIAPSAVRTSYRIGSRYRKFKRLEKEHPVITDNDQSVGVFGEVMFSRMMDSAQRDMVGGWGQAVLVSHEEGLSGSYGELPGHNTLVSVNQFVPSIIKHQGFELRAIHQNQEGSVSYNRDICIPRGYRDDETAGGLNLRKNLMFSLEYHFPLWFPDRGLGVNLCHLHLLKGSFFVDYGAGWDTDFTVNSWTEKALTTIGATLTAQTSVLVAFLPVEFGIAAGYKTHEKEGFARGILYVGF